MARRMPFGWMKSGSWQARVLVTIILLLSNGAEKLSTSLCSASTSIKFGFYYTWDAHGDYVDDLWVIAK